MNYGPLVALPLLLAQAQERPAYRVAVEAVRVDVFVSRKGKALLGLTKDDFELFDNGVRQEIELVGREREPVSVALVLDVSDSVVGTPLNQLKAAADAFLRGLGPSDRATLVTFSHYIQQLSPMTSDFPSLHEAIDRVQARGRTSWHDALFAGLELLEGSSRRPLLLLFTDGEDTYSWLRGEQLPPLVRQSSAVVYALSKKSPSGRGRVRGISPRAKLLEEVTRAGGGRLIEAESTDEVAAGFQQVLTEMRNRYLLAYHPQGVRRDGWHTIEVKLRHRKGDVRARRGYFYRPREH